MLSQELFSLLNYSLLVNEMVRWSPQTNSALLEAMTPPPIRINTFVQTKSSPVVDTLSKVYIIGGLLVGINRLPIISNKYIFIIPSLIYSLSGICAILYLTYLRNGLGIYTVVIVLNVVMYVFCLFSNLIFYKRMRRYYYETNKFDMEVGCRPKIDRLSIRCYIQMCVIISCIFILFFLPYEITTLNKLFMHLIPVHVAYSSELHYYGHILSLLIPRLRLINFYMQISLTTARNTKTTIANKYVLFKNYNENSNCEMKKIIDLYYIIYQCYNYLIEAIKWQMLLIIVTSFITVLAFTYHFSLHIITGEKIMGNLIADLGLSLIIMVPLFAPCVYGDYLHSEVRGLRELLASRLYENKLDKSSRSIARALLEFTGNRDLSFRLLRILDVDISLPFKFVGLLVTYLIIMMQFEKVIHP